MFHLTHQTLNSSVARFSLFCGLRLYNISHGYSIPKTEFIDRRHKLAAEVARSTSMHLNTKSKHLIVLPSAEIQYMAYHIPYPFLQDSNFMYFTGLKDVIGVLLLMMNVEPNGSTNPNYTCEEHLFVQIRTPQEEIWDGPSVKESTVSELTGIHSTNSLKELSTFLKHHSRGSTLWYAPFVDSESDKTSLNKLVLSEIFKIKDNVRQNVRSPQPIIDELRFVKSENEIVCLRHAANATVDCLKETIRASHPGVFESFIRNKLEFECGLRGLTMGYPPVVAGGDRANVIHYLRNNKRIEDGDLVLVDVGCRSEGYTADLTRTWPVNGRYTSIQLVLHEILVETLKKCSDSATPDHSLSDVHNIMLQELQRHLVNECIIPQVDNLTLVQKICPHHVGHFLGLDIHDTPTIPYSRRLKPGVVFPLEPGIYFRPEFIQYGVHKECVGIGMRLEDDFVISGCGRAELLTDQLPREASVLASLTQPDSAISENGLQHSAKSHA